MDDAKLERISENDEECRALMDAFTRIDSPKMRANVVAFVEGIAADNFDTAN